MSLKSNGRWARKKPSLSDAKIGLPQISSDLPVVGGIAGAGRARGGGAGRTHETRNSSFLGQHLALPAEEVLRFQREGGRESPCLPESKMTHLRTLRLSCHPQSQPPVQPRRTRAGNRGWGAGRANSNTVLSEDHKRIFIKIRRKVTFRWKKIF